MRPATYTASSGATAITGAEEVDYTYHAQGYLATIQTESTTYSFTYDAFGNKTTKYLATDTGHGVSTNYIGYRGYYYDIDLGLYFTQTRLYDPTTGRFISADEEKYLGANGDINSYNLYAYCSNNSVNFSDPSGHFIWGIVIALVVILVGEDLVNSLELEIGVGYGIGFDISNNVTAELSRDTYVGIDDGVIVTGNTISAEISLFDSDISIGETYNHMVEKDGVRVSSSGKPWHGPFDMIFYPDVTHGNQFAIGPLVVNDSGEVLLSVSAGAHLGGGGHVSIAFNITEFIQRLGVK